MTREYIKLEQEGKSFENWEFDTGQAAREAVQEGDVINGTVMAGQIAGMISKKQSCKEMIEEMMEQASGLALELRGEEMSRIAFIFPGQEHRSAGWARFMSRQRQAKSLTKQGLWAFHAGAVFLRRMTGRI